MYSYERIYVAVDGSKEADYAFDKAVGICSRNEGSTLTAIHVFNRGYQVGISEVSDKTLVESQNERSNQIVDYYKNKAKDYGIPCEVKLKEGLPSSTLLAEFKALTPNDLVVCGSSNLGRLAKLFVGSVSNDLVNRSSCDVLVVRTPEIHRA